MAYRQGQDDSEPTRCNEMYIIDDSADGIPRLFDIYHVEPLEQRTVDLHSSNAQSSPAHEQHPNLVDFSQKC